MTSLYDTETTVRYGGGTGDGYEDPENWQYQGGVISGKIPGGPRTGEAFDISTPGQVAAEGQGFTQENARRRIESMRRRVGGVYSRDVVLRRGCPGGVRFQCPFPLTRDFGSKNDRVTKSAGACNYYSR